MVVQLLRDFSKWMFPALSSEESTGKKTDTKTKGINPTPERKGRLKSKPSLFKSKPDRKVDKVYIHCSASSNPHHDDVSVIEKWHKERWPELCATECGYHYFIPWNGELQKSRSLERIPVAQSGHNSNTITVCLHGKEKEDFTVPQFNTLRTLCEDIHTIYNEIITFHGHCEVDDHKSCPVFDYQFVLGLDMFGRLESKGPLVLPTLKYGSRGIPVEYLQQRLGIVDDGKFGRDTMRAVHDYQRMQGLQPDGIVGPKTWGTLVEIKNGELYERS